MRGAEEQAGSLFSYVDLEARVPRGHPLRAIRAIVDEALAALSADFDAIYAPIGRPSIPPEQLLRALLLQAFYTVRSERQLMEQLDYNLLFRWFVGLGVDDADANRPSSRRTGTGSWTARSQRNSSPPCSITPGFAGCSQTSTSRSTARSFELGRA